MSIYIIAHKNFDVPVSDEFYKVLQVGTDINGVINDSWCMDNTGDNISEKNLSYNELTGLYWIWKNTSEDVVGLCHYRRYFVTHIGKMKNLLFGRKQGYIDREHVDKVLLDKDMIVHNKTYFKQGCKKQYLQTQKYPEDINILREVLINKYPEYVEAYDEVMTGKKCHLLNMIITRRDTLNRYCEWLFDILNEIESILISKGEKSFERRLGMLGERMLDIWIVANNINIKEVYSINTERKDWKAW